MKWNCTHVRWDQVTNRRNIGFDSKYAQMIRVVYAICLCILPDMLPPNESTEPNRKMNILVSTAAALLVTIRGSVFQERALSGVN